MSDRVVKAEPKPLTNTDLQAAIANYATLVYVGSTFAPIVHTHAISDVTNLQTALDGKAALSHTHGNITNAGAIGSTANLPLITTTSGVITTGSFGTTANTFCQGNDSRLSNARTPTSHVHGNISNAGAIGTTSGLPIITGSSGVLQVGAFGTTSGTFAQGNDTRIANAAQRNASNTFTANPNVFNTNVGIWGSPLDRFSVFSSISGSEFRVGNSARSIRDGADATPHLQLLRSGWSQWNLAHSAENLVLYLDASSADPEVGFVNGGWLRSRTGIIFGNASGCRLKNDSGTVAVRNFADSSGASLSCLNLTLSGLAFLGSYTFATLPIAASNTGALARITDCNTTTNGANAAGGGSSNVMVFSNGTNWKVTVG